MERKRWGKSLLKPTRREGVGEVACLNGDCQFGLWVGLIINREVIKKWKKCPVSVTFGKQDCLLC